MEPVFWYVVAVLFGCGFFLRMYGAADHWQFASQVLLLAGWIGLFGGLSAIVTDYVVVGALIGSAIGIALDDRYAQVPLRQRLEVRLDKLHWKGPGPRNDAPPL